MPFSGLGHRRREALGVQLLEKTKDKINCLSISTDHGLYFGTRTNRVAVSIKDKGPALLLRKASAVSVALLTRQQGQES